MDSRVVSASAEAGGRAESGNEAAVSAWLDTLAAVEPLEDLDFDTSLVRRLERRCAERASGHRHRIRLHTPSFKSYQSSELPRCGKQQWPAVSVTGADCALQCDHCKARILAPMVAAPTPERLWAVASEAVAAGARGLLLSGGSNRHNEVVFTPFYGVLRHIKDTFPEFRIAAHTGLVTPATASDLSEAGVDVAMLDIIGAQETVTQVYHLRRKVADFERALAALVATKMSVVPHVVVGLHYGRVLGELTALEMIARHAVDAVVLVVVMPQYASPKRPFATPDADAVGHLFAQARELLPATPLLLGCARPAGGLKARIDAYAVMAGFDALAHPSDGAVELALRLGHDVSVVPSCCAVGLGDEWVLTDESEPVLRADLEILRQQRATSAPLGVDRPRT